MLTDRLFKEILIKPAKELGVDRLQIVSGFATAAMADWHMEALHKRALEKRIRIDLIVGMTPTQGIEKAQHRALQALAREAKYEGLDFNCQYVAKSDPVHAKTYCWLSDGSPVFAFVGSANYTRMGFGCSQTEAMERADRESVHKFYAEVSRNAVDCLAPGIEDLVTLYETKWLSGETDSGRHERRPHTLRRFRQSPEDLTQPDDAGQSITVSLLVGSGETPKRSGINWGQREKRDRDQAYISLPASKREFFPPRTERFTVLTDDGESLIMVRAQDAGKALHTTYSNALLGQYLRARMGVPSGEYVSRQHLDSYGRTDLTFTKIDEETYLMDFRPDTRSDSDTETG